MKRVYAREEVCAGCKLCEVYCAVAHSKYPDNVLKAYQKQDTTLMSRILVEINQPLTFALQCRHCEEAYCTQACITGAMSKDPETGIVINDESRCIGCWTCILVCPYGAIKRDESGHKVASKCDLCSNNELSPICVQKCPNNALIFAETARGGK